MTTAEWLRSLSSAPQGSTALNVVADITGTYPVLTPIESFTTNMEVSEFTANLDIISITANINIDNITANFVEDVYTANLDMENYNVSINTN